jgi:DNA-binding NarL/FixJ family response regulator
MKRITVLLADDNSVVRRRFRKLLEVEDDLEVVGEAKNGLQAIALVKKLCPELVLMDIAMPMLNGLQAPSRILEAVPDTKVLILSARRWIKPGGPAALATFTSRPPARRLRGRWPSAHWLRPF